jgi:hypothetical protein
MSVYQQLIEVGREEGEVLWWEFMVTVWYRITLCTRKSDSISQGPYIYHVSLWCLNINQLPIK